MLKLIARLPEWALWALLAAVVAVVLGIGASGGWAARAVIADRDVDELKAELAEERRQRAEDRATLAQAAQQAEARARTIETEREALKQEIADAARHAETARTAAAAELRRTVERLRKPAARSATDVAAQGAGLAVRSPAAAAADLVPTDMYWRLADLASDLAIAFDDAHARGLTCERAHEALTAVEVSASSE